MTSVPSLPYTFTYLPSTTSVIHPLLVYTEVSASCQQKLSLPWLSINIGCIEAGM